MGEKLTGLRRAVLWRAARDVHPYGTALVFEQQAGRSRQVEWLVKAGLAEKSFGRLRITPAGRQALDQNGGEHGG